MGHQVSLYTHVRKRLITYRHDYNITHCCSTHFIYRQKLCIVVALILIIITSSQPVGSLTSQVTYVQPFSEVSAYASEPCMFDQFAQNPEQYFLSSTTFIFLPGDHQLNNNISLHGVWNISFQGMSVEEPATIKLGS